jgi:putative ABC transport system permease protein
LTGKVNPRPLDEPFSVVLSRTAAAIFFGGANPVGKTVTINKHDYDVTGVIEDIPANSCIRPDFIVSFASLDSLLTYNNYTQDWLTSWAKGYSVTPTYVLLDDPARAAEVSSSIERLLDENRAAAGYEDETGEDVHLQPLQDIYLGSAQDWQVNQNGDPKRLIGMGAAVLLILLVAGINIINLVVTIWQDDVRRMDTRRVERRRFRLFLRFASESFLVTILALTFGLFAAVLLLPLFSGIVDRELLIQTRLIPWIVLCSLPFAAITGAVAALNPEAFVDKKAVRPRGGSVVYREYHRTRHGRLLVAFQFVVAAALVFTSSVMIAQTRFIRTMPLGYDKENLLVASFQRGAMQPDRFRELKGALLDLPGVESASASYSVPEGCPGETRLRMLGNDSDRGVRSQLFIADDDFLDTYRIERLTEKGKNIKAPDGWEFWINRTAVEAMGWKNPKDAVGKNIESVGACNKNWHLVVGGVFEDYHQCPVYHGIVPLVICIPPEDTYWNLTLRLDGKNSSATAAAVTDEWKRLRPDVDVEPYFLSHRLAQITEEEYRVARQLMLLALIVLVIACAGLVGLVSYTVHQKEREISAWRDQGRGRLQVTARLGGGFVLMIVTAVLLAWPVSFLATNQWLQKFAAQVGAGPGLYFLAGGGVILLGLIVVFIPAAGKVFFPNRPSRNISEVVYGR